MNNKTNQIPSDKATYAGKAAFFLIASGLVWTTLFYGTVHQPILSLFYLMIFGICTAWIVDSFISGSFRFDSNPVQLPVAAIALYGLVQIIPFGSVSEGGLAGISRTISVEPFATQTTVLHFAALFVFLAAVLRFVDTRSRLRSVVILVAVFGFSYAFYAILQLVLSPDKIYGIYTSEFAAPFGSFVNRHNFAAYMEMAICLPLGLLFAGAIHKDKKLLYVTGVGVMAVALLLSGSRGGLVSIVAGAAFLGLNAFGRAGKRKIIVRAVAAALIVGAIIVGSFLIGGESSLTRIADTTSSENVTANRSAIWKASVSMISSSMPFGVGIGAYGTAYSRFDTSSGLERVEQAHNDYLQTITDAGLPGAVIGLAFLFFLFRTGFRAMKSKDRYIRGAAMGALAGCFAVLIHSLFDFVLHTTAVALLFLTLTGILGFCYRQSRLEETQVTPTPEPKNITPIASHLST